MISIVCVLKSGGVYDAEWVRKLRDGVARHLDRPHRFVCYSDVDVPCETLSLRHDWPGWWSKIELFDSRICGPALYFDLDTVITGSINEFCDLPYDFAMLDNFNQSGMVGSGVMWFRDRSPTVVYELFAGNAQRIMDHYNRVRHGSYRGDQAFIWDTLDRKVDKLASPALRSYKKHCRNALPEGTSIVCFHGRPRPTEINPPWLQEHWR